ncbi:MAG: hypothetical protein ACJ8AW_38060 [Rhodopila sp.]
MAGTERRQAVASLLRIASADLHDARLVLQNGQGRNAAAVGARALASLVLAVAASEQGWPAEDAEARDIPRENPLQPELLAIDVLLDDAADQRVLPNGRPEPSAGMNSIVDALDRLDDALETVVNAFGVDLAGQGPATRAEPIRPPEPEDEAAVTEAEPHYDEPSQPASVVSAKPPRRRGRSWRPERDDMGADEALPEKPVIVGTASSDKGRKVGRKATQAGDQAPKGRKARPGRASAGAEVARSGPVLGPTTRSQDYTSTAFWALMDHWKLSDTEALELIGHAGGLTRKGTRPRFTVAGTEAEIFGHLREIEAALAPLTKDPGAWMRQPIKDAPFKGAAPLSYITQNGVKGSRAVEQAILMTALRRQRISFPAYAATSANLSSR